VSQEQKNRIQQVIQTNPDTAPDGVFSESKQEAFDSFKKLYKDSPIVSTVTQDQMQESFRVKLKDPQRYQNLVSAVAGLPGVDTVQDLRQYLDPLFKALNGLQVGALVAAGLLLLAALMQISNTIRLAAYARRREIGIMRLVGASNFYIQLPFLLEAVLAALIGAVLACVVNRDLIGLGLVDADLAVAKQNGLCLGLEFGYTTAFLFDVRHHLDVFAGAAIVDGARLNVVDFIDNFFVAVPLEVRLSRTETGGGRVHFFQDGVECAGIGGRLRCCGNLHKCADQSDRSD